MTKYGNVGSEPSAAEPSHEERGREVLPTGKSTRGKSRDVLTSMGDRLGRMEDGINGVETRIGGVERRMDDIEEELSQLSDAIKERLNHLEASSRGGDLDELKAYYEDEMGRMRSAHERQMQGVMQQMEDMKADLALFKRAFATGPAPITEARRVDLPKPRSYSGTRNAKEVENFLWGLEQYFKATGIRDDDHQIQTAVCYLTDTAMLWWRRRQEDIRRGMCSILTFKEFKAELKRQFYPENAEEEARGRLRRLKQTGSVRDYVKEFTSLVLEIPEMSDKDALFFFVDGLQHWAKTELKRRGVQDLASAIAVAEGLIDYSNPKEKESSKPRENREDPSYSKERSKSPARSRSRPESNKPDSEKTRITRCFLCDGPHYMKNCPKRNAINAMSAEVEEPAECEDDERAQIGSIQLLNVMQAAPRVQAKGLLCVDAMINGMKVAAMIDTGATHNFVSVEEAQRLGLKTDNGGGTVKAVNSEARCINGTSRGVKTRLGAWEGLMDYSVVPMDDYKVILGVEFLDRVKGFPIPFANTMIIMDGEKTYVVPTRRATRHDFRLLSAMEGIGKEVTKRKHDVLGGSKDVMLRKPPISLAKSYEGTSLAPTELAKVRHAQVKLARAYLDRATKRIEEWAMKKKKHQRVELSKEQDHSTKGMDLLTDQGLPGSSRERARRGRRGNWWGRMSRPAQRA